MIFSQRYHRALSEGRLSVDISLDVRRKFKTALDKFDTHIGVRRDPSDNWVSNSSVAEETILELLSEHGWEDVPGADYVSQGHYYEAFKHVISNSDGEIIFDYIEISMAFLDIAERERCRVKLNQIFDLHECPWRIADGEFFKLDADFMGERLAAGAHDALAANQFAGAAQEYAKARQAFGSGEVKDSVFYACKSFESVMKVMTNENHLNADQLIKAMSAQNYFDDLPEEMRSGFVQQVMKTVPFLRNKLGGHGQGAAIVEVPAVYGELALQLTATFHNFLISKHLERTPPAPMKTVQSNLDDDIPF